MFLVFCFVLKGGRDADMLIKGRKETSREGNLDILKRERNWGRRVWNQIIDGWLSLKQEKVT